MEIAEAPEELCPACSSRPQEDERTGFCDTCAGDRMAQLYVEADAAAIAQRRSTWVERSRTRRELIREYERERQRRHRLLERVRPREPAPSYADPFRLAEEALSHLSVMHQAIRAGPLREHLEVVEELIRQLAWGPDDSLPG